MNMEAWHAALYGIAELNTTQWLNWSSKRAGNPLSKPFSCHLTPQLILQTLNKCYLTILHTYSISFGGSFLMYWERDKWSPFDPFSPGHWFPLDQSQALWLVIAQYLEALEDSLYFLLDTLSLLDSRDAVRWVFHRHCIGDHMVHPGHTGTPHEPGDLGKATEILIYSSVPGYFWLVTSAWNWFVKICQMMEGWIHDLWRARSGFGKWGNLVRNCVAGSSEFWEIETCHRNKGYLFFAQGRQWVTDCA